VSEDQILTIKDVAAILKLAEKTVYSMAQDGELPAFKVRGQWRIRRVDFDRWIAKQATGTSGSNAR
jgi:excisionase family DNA binding protein